MTNTMIGTATSTAAALPALGQVTTTAAAMRAAADLLEMVGIAGLSVSCTDYDITVQVTEELADAAGRARLVARLGAAIGVTAVQVDSSTGHGSWVRAEGGIGGLRFRIFTDLRVRHTDAGPLAADQTGRIAQATADDDAATPMPAGWRWLTDLDPDPTPEQSARQAGAAR